MQGVSEVEQRLLEALEASKGAIGCTAEDDDRFQALRDAVTFAVVDLRAMRSSVSA